MFWAEALIKLREGLPRPRQCEGLTESGVGTKLDLWIEVLELEGQGRAGTGTSQVSFAGGRFGGVWMLLGNWQNLARQQQSKAASCQQRRLL